MGNQFISRRIIAACIVIVVAVIVIVALGRLFMTPRFLLQAPVGSVVTLVNVASGHTEQKFTAKSSHTSIFVKSGSYMLLIAYKNDQQEFFANMHYFSRKQFTYVAADAIPAQPVAQISAFNPIQVNSGILFLNTDSQEISKLSADKSVSPMTLPDNIPPYRIPDSDAADVATSAQSFSPQGSTALVMLNDYPYIVTESTVSPVSITGISSNATRLIATNPMQQSFILSSNQTLYSYASAASAPQKVTTIPTQFDQLAYGGNKAIVYSTRMPYSTTDIRPAYNAYAIDPILVSLDTKRQQTLTMGPITNASISPDGHYAIIQTPNSAYSTIVDLTTLKPVGAIDNPDNLMPFWISDHSYLYGKGSNVWQADLKNSTATHISSLPSNLVTSITCSQPAHTCLVTTYPTKETAGIYSFTLK